MGVVGTTVIVMGQLLVLLLATTSTNAQNFDFFYLVMQWPPAFCNQRGASCRTPIINNRFTIHGMWPQKNNGQSPQNCPGRGRVDAPTMALLDTHWPNLQRPPNTVFWTYEWNKHGTCSGWTLQRYFRTAVDRAVNVNVFQKLATAGIRPNNRMYRVNTIRNSLQRLNPLVNCNMNSRRVAQIKEIWVCVHKDGSRVVACPGRSRAARNCGRGSNPNVLFPS
ncbi:Intracellular ribonuclease LX [Linum grandiflorum]